MLLTFSFSATPNCNKQPLVQKYCIQRHNSFHFFSIISIGKINFQSRQSELIILRPILWVRGGWRGCSYLLFENLLCNLHQVVPKEAFVTQRKGKTSQHYQMDGKHWDETSIYYWSFWEILLHFVQELWHKIFLRGNGFCHRRNLTWLVIQQQRPHWWASFLAFSTAQAWVLQPLPPSTPIAPSTYPNTASTPSTYPSTPYCPKYPSTLDSPWGFCLRLPDSRRGSLLDHSFPSP